jgi:hypothetical protein
VTASDGVGALCFIGPDKRFTLFDPNAAGRWRPDAVYKRNRPRSFLLVAGL